MIQVQQAIGDWRHVTLPAGHVAILPGYTLERATCGLVKATPHRVVSVNLSFPDLWTCFTHTTLPACHRVVAHSTCYLLSKLTQHNSYKSVVRPWQHRAAKLRLRTPGLLFMIAPLSAGDGHLCCSQFSQCTGLQAESQRTRHPQPIPTLEAWYCCNHSCKV